MTSPSPGAAFRWRPRWRSPCACAARSADRAQDRLSLPARHFAMGAVVDGSPPITVRNEDIIRAAEASPRRSSMKSAGSRSPRSKGDDGDRPRGPPRDRDPGGGPSSSSMTAWPRERRCSAALRALLSALAPKTIVLAIPVAPTETLFLEEMRQLADKVVCLEEYGFFGAIGAYYDDFRQVGDEEPSSRSSNASPRRRTPRAKNGAG